MASEFNQNIEQKVIKWQQSCKMHAIKQINKSSQKSGHVYGNDGQVFLGYFTYCNDLSGLQVSRKK